MAAPQVIGFGDASPDEIAQIRAGTYGETFDEQTYIAMNENRDGDQVTGSYQYVDPLGSLIIVTYTAGVMGYSETREVQPNYVEIKPRPVKQQTTTSSFVGSSGSNSGFGSSGSNSGFGSSGSNSGFSGSSSGFGSSSFGSSSNFGSSSSNNFGSSGSSSFNADSIVNSVVSAVQPLISSTVSNAVGGGSRRPVAVLSTPPPLAAPAPITTSFNSNDIVSQVVSNIQPLISSTVSNAVGSSSGRFNSRTSSSSTPASTSASFNPVPIAAPRRPAPAVSSSSSINDLFGNGDTFNVRFNTPDFEIQY